MFELDFYGTLVAASLVLLLGRGLVARIGFLRVYNIPEPVAGGLVVALALLALRSFDVQVQFDTSLQTPLMLAFFATIGLSADFASLKKGGRVVAVFLLVVTGLLLVQNAMGIGLATALGLDPLMGLLAGSISLSGGHGTGAAWGATFTEKFGLASASELAMASATFGLVLGGLIGGPVAKLLIKRVKTQGTEEEVAHLPKGFEQPNKERLITSFSFIETLALIAVSLLVGTVLNGLLKGTAFELPTFVCVLFVGVLLRNGLSAFGFYHVFEREVSVLGNVSLSLFLAIALMSLKLWDLAALALPFFVLLAAQTLVMALFAIFVTFRVMGRNYDAAVLAAGHCGFGLGATPTAIANMQAVTQRYGASHIAFLVVPMVGAFFIDIINVIVIKLYLALPLFIAG
ncbi:TPA: sodium/glutamate symporter [Pseudomonas putida]|jgi:ESS family glutamate:Na+ symporter|uniref:Sodium/glutamate symporter n=1 Tax=Pseudomonas putida S13.1.2 TaxID=1384061 RepID=A0AAU8RZU9_PSEPU|nr:MULTISPECIES: sodium/glutamate symporter [Pseudomonas]AJQ48876.1 sodium:glutamate symporter [Pseudomonas putida S13.1.2]MCS4064575.1 ESS family glutamate:Na+ symporter [Pseudomonas putida]MDD1995818.1 sodium/glutamate symporter [Pseudomonas putida]TCP76243.1 ESS family glutamate:Na+ symporter [Pseudomonas putida]HDS0920082.1 sodium/glutamate symporter [Pseudomonas putida]